MLSAWISQQIREVNSRIFALETGKSTLYFHEKGSDRGGRKDWETAESGGDSRTGEPGKNVKNGIFSHIFRQAGGVFTAFFSPDRLRFPGGSGHSDFC